MRVKMNTLSAGPAGCFQPGSEREVDKEEGEALIAGGFAVSLDSAAVDEVADAPSAPEHAVVKRGKKASA